MNDIKGIGSLAIETKNGIGLEKSILVEAKFHPVLQTILFISPTGKIFSFPIKDLVGDFEIKGIKFLEA
jgi:hypothetical protein